MTFAISFIFYMSLYHKNKILGSLFFLPLILFSYLKVLLGRSTLVQGIDQSLDILSSVNFKLSFDYILGVSLNLFQGTLNVANSLLLNPEHTIIYKKKSFSLLVSSLDGFSHIINQHAIRINKFVPLNAFSEVINFGIGYLLAYLCVVFVWLRLTTVIFLMRRNIISFSVFILSVWVMMQQSQYALRTSFRQIIFLIIISWIYIKLNKNQNHKDNILT